MSSDPLVLERLYDAPVKNVWRAITDKESMKAWLFDMPDFVPVVGTVFSFVGTDLDGKEWVHRCRVTKVVPEKLLEYTWRYEGVEGESVVTWELFAEGSKTRLRLTHAGLQTFPPLKSLARENFAAGWSDLLGVQLPVFLQSMPAAPQ